jgi:hypothetical protein
MHEYVLALDKSLSLVRAASKKFQDSLVSERTSVNEEKPQNKYQPGDLVLRKLEIVPDKLSTKFQGPFEVISQDKNDVACRHLVQRSVHVFHVTELKIFHGNLSEATNLAMVDFNQYVIKEFLAFRGDPNTRTTMEFLVEFEDGAQVWKPWSKDISDTVPFENFCRSNAPLQLLLFNRTVSDRMAKEFRLSDIIEVRPNDIVFVDLRSYGSTWYNSLHLPDADKTTFVLKYIYKDFVKGRKRINAFCPVFAETFLVDRVFVKLWGSQKILLPNWVLIDEEFVQRYPQLLLDTPPIAVPEPILHVTQILQRGIPT